MLAVLVPQACFGATRIAPGGSLLVLLRPWKQWLKSTMHSSQDVYKPEMLAQTFLWRTGEPAVKSEHAIASSDRGDATDVCGDKRPRKYA